MNKTDWEEMLESLLKHGPRSAKFIPVVPVRNPARIIKQGLGKTAENMGLSVKAITVFKGRARNYGLVPGLNPGDSGVLVFGVKRLEESKNV